MQTANFESYGQYASSNYGVNALVFTDPDGNMFYFSYKTLVAFIHNAPGKIGVLTIRENDWNNTTGKHLNWINSDKAIRVSGEEFEAIYAATFNREA